MFACIYYTMHLTKYNFVHSYWTLLQIYEKLYNKTITNRLLVAIDRTFINIVKKYKGKIKKRRENGL